MNWISIEKPPIENYTYVLLNVIAEEKEVTALGFYSVRYSTGSLSFKVIDWLGNFVAWQLPIDFKPTHWQPIPVKIKLEEVEV
jgi:hypothetical protein